MIPQKFRIKKKDYENRFYTTLKCKIIKIMKCYTLHDLKFSNDNTFTFYKTHRINNYKFKDKNQHFGEYSIKDINDEELELTILITK